MDKHILSFGMILGDQDLLVIKLTCTKYELIQYYTGCFINKNWKNSRHT